MGDTLGAAPEAHLFAEVVPPLAAEAALAAAPGDADLEGHAVAGGKAAADVGADGDDDPGRLVAEGQRLAGAEIAVGKVPKVRNVGAAEARGAQGDLELAGGGRVEGPVFLLEEGEKWLVDFLFFFFFCL